MDEFKELYENLSPNKLSIENVTQLETKVELLEKEIKQLEAALNRSELDKRNLNINYERDKKALLDNHESLTANISALFKTAKREIERKNDTIKELRQQLDDFIFRRHQRRWPPQNEVQSQNVDDAASAKAAKEDRTVASVIRPTARNHVFNDREKSSSGDKSPVPARLSARQYEYSERDKRVDSSRDSRDKCVPDCRLKGCDKLKYPHSSFPEGSPDEFLDLRNSADFYPYSRSDRRTREADDLECRIHRKVKDRHRYSPYKHSKEDHERSRLRHLRRERSHDDDEYSKSRAKRSPYDRGRHEFGDGYRAIDSRQKPDCDSQKLRDQIQGASDCRRREAKSSFRKSIGDRRTEASAYQKLIDDRRRQSPSKLRESRKSNEDRRREDLAVPESNVRLSFENRKKEAEAPQTSVEDQRREHPANLVGRNVNDGRRDDLVYAKSGVRNSIESQRKENAAYEKLIADQKRKSPATLEFGGRNSKVHPAPNPKKPIGDQSKEQLDHRKSIDNPSAVSCVNPELVGRKPVGSRIKKEVDHQKLVKDQRQGSLTNLELASQKSIEDRHKENAVAVSECSGKKLTTKQKKEDPNHAKSVATQPTNNQKDLIHAEVRKPINDRKSEATVTEFGGKKLVVDRARGNVSNPKRVAKKPNENRQSANAANSSQTLVENQVPSASHIESAYPDGQMKAIDILAQYGVYATPYKLLNGDKGVFANFKQISPIADTPDHLKALFNNSKTKAKVNPIPMINEHRALEGFISPAKKPDTLEVAKEDSAAANRSSIEEPPKTMADNSLVGPSPSKLLILNTVITSPFKNCCIVKVKAANTAAETAAKESSTVCGTDSTDTEHGVFTRKRRTPVIRRIEKKSID